MISRLEICFSLRQQKLFCLGDPYVPAHDEFLLDHSRSGILLSLKAAGLPQGAGVGVLVYNCHTVMNAVEQAGCKPVFLDITDDLTVDMDDLRHKADQLCAVIVTHLFGIINDVKAIKDEFPGLILIEDCAHAYGIQGLYGDFATFSIGQGKLPSIGDGGILKVLNDEYKESVEMLYADLPNYSKFQGVKLFLDLSVKSIMHSRFVYGWLTLPMKNKRFFSSGKETIIPRKMCRGISAVYALEKNKVAAQIEKRKQKANKILDCICPWVIKDYLGSNAFMLVVKCNNPAKLQKRLVKRGVDSATHFANAIRWGTEFGYEEGQCPNAERLIKQLLMIPVY